MCIGGGVYMHQFVPPLDALLIILIGIFELASAMLGIFGICQENICLTMAVSIIREFVFGQLLK